MLCRPEIPCDACEAVWGPDNGHTNGGAAVQARPVPHTQPNKSSGKPTLHMYVLVEHSSWLTERTSPARARADAAFFSASPSSSGAPPQCTERTMYAKHN